MIEAGILRHRVTIQRPVYGQSPTGAPEPQTWEDVFPNKIAARVNPLSGREYITANQIKSAVTTRITVRHFAGLNAEMRILFRDKIYNIQAVLPDNDSGLEYDNLMCIEGVNAG